MLAREMLTKQFEYNLWANRRVLDEAAGVTAEQWEQKGSPESRSLREVLAHMLIVERNWRLLSAHGMVGADEVLRLEDLPDVRAMHALATKETEYMQILLADWSDEAFSEVESVTRWDGRQVSLVRWHMLQHLLLHSMQHRSEAGMLLTAYGRSPGDLDFIFFVTPG